jgi:hypothetical protein
MRQKKIMTKHCMFGSPNLRQSQKKIAQPLVAMLEKLRMSAETLPLISVNCSFALGIRAVLHFNVM